MPYDDSSASSRVRTLGAGLTIQSYHSSLRVKLAGRPCVSGWSVSFTTTRPGRTAGFSGWPSEIGADEAGVERVDVVLALPDRPAGVVHAHVAAAAADVGLERRALGGVEEHAAGLGEDHRVDGGEVRGGERRRVVGLLDLDRLAVLGRRARRPGHARPGAPARARRGSCPCRTAARSAGRRRRGRGRGDAERPRRPRGPTRARSNRRRGRARRGEGRRTTGASGVLLDGAAGPFMGIPWVGSAST